MKYKLLFCLLMLPAVALAAIFPSRITQILLVGDTLVDTVDVAYESYFSAIGLSVSRQPMSTGKIVKKLAVRALWKEILTRAHWQEANTDELTKRLALAKNRWNKQGVTIDQSMFAWYQRREALKIRIATFIGSRTVLEQKRSPRDTIVTLLEEALQTTRWEILDEDWFATQVTGYAPGAIFDAIR